MLSNNSQEISSGSYIAVPPTSDIPTLPVGPQPTAYDYLLIIPAFITAVTPLILGWKKKPSDKDEDKGQLINCCRGTAVLCPYSRTKTHS